MSDARDMKDALRGTYVLFVDDDADVRELYVGILESCGAIVRAAASAREALQLIEEIRPNVVVTDISMPQEDGYWLLRELRKSPTKGVGDIPVLAITAHERHSRDRTLAAGFQEHMMKPINPWKLAELVRKLATQAP